MKYFIFIIGALLTVVTVYFGKTSNVAYWIMCGFTGFGFAMIVNYLEQRFNL